MKNPNWLSRWRKYPGSIIGHMMQGAACGFVAAYGYHWPAAVWLAASLAYQFGSGARKWSYMGHPDTVGLDTIDYAAGFVVGYAAAALLRWI